MEKTAFESLLKLTPPQASTILTVHRQDGCKITYQSLADKSGISRSYAKKTVKSFSDKGLLQKDRIHRGIMLQTTDMFSWLKEGLQKFLRPLAPHSFLDRHLHRLRAMTIEQFLQSPEMLAVDWKDKKPTVSILQNMMREFSLTKEQMFLHLCQFSYDLNENGKAATVNKPLNYFYGCLKVAKPRYQVKGYRPRIEILADQDSQYKAQQSRQLWELKERYAMLREEFPREPELPLLTDSQRLETIQRSLAISQKRISSWKKRFGVSQTQLLDFLEFFVASGQVDLKEFEAVLIRLGYYPVPPMFHSLQQKALEEATARLRRYSDLKREMLKKEFDQLDPTSTMYQMCLKKFKEKMGWLLSASSEAGKICLLEIYRGIKQTSDSVPFPLEGT